MESGMAECFGPIAEKNGIVWTEFARPFEGLLYVQMDGRRSAEDRPEMLVNIPWKFREMVLPKKLTAKMRNS